jgi:hypothetical protein
MIARTIVAGRIKVLAGLFGLKTRAWELLARLLGSAPNEGVTLGFG